MEAKDYREVIDVDLLGPFTLAKKAVILSTAKLFM